jgi:hypothetical protein
LLFICPLTFYRLSWSVPINGESPHPGLAGADIRRAERASKKPIYMSLRRIAAARAIAGPLIGDRRFASALMRCHGGGLRDARLCAAPPAASGLSRRTRNRNAACRTAGVLGCADATIQ